MSNEYQLNTTEHLYRNRIIYLSGDIATPSSEHVVGRLLVLDSIDPRTEIRLYISSFGGSVHAGLAIYDAMQLIEAPVSTFCLGPAFSMAAWLLAAGAKGRRYASQHSRIMIHQISGGMSGTTSDIKVAAQNMLESERLTSEILSRHTGRTATEIERATERDRWMTPGEALEFGIIDAVVPASAGKVVPTPVAASF